MGCGASANKHDDQTERRDHRASKREQRDPVYVENSSPVPEHLDDNDDHPAITSSIMTDLRNRSRDHATGGTVQRWIESIAEPGEADAPDVYDPARRHMLSMESLNLRLNQE